MNIQRISKSDGDVTLVLEVSELALITSALRKVVDANSILTMKKIYSNLMLFENLVKYGSIDDDAMDKIYSLRTTECIAEMEG